MVREETWNLNRTVLLHELAMTSNSSRSCCKGLKTIVDISTDEMSESDHIAYSTSWLLVQIPHGNPEKYLVIMDESHVTLPQLGGMHAGDRSRKRNLVEQFRLPSAYDNRPLHDEFQNLVPQMMYVSATPGERELRHLAEVTEQKIQLD